jgi:Chromosome segregation ATPases
MGVYIGCIEKKGNEPGIYFNFRPLCEIKNDQVILLTPDERRKLLPESSLENVNLSYNYNNTEQRNYMENHFSEECLVILEFETDKLLPNEVRGERNTKTGYKIFASEAFDQGKIRYLENENISLLVSNSEFDEKDFENETNMPISGTGIYADVTVFCEVSNGMLAGPYKVGFREFDREFYIRPQLKESKYLISGYRRSDCNIIKVNSSDGYWGQDILTWTLVYPKFGVERIFEDKIGIEQLLISFKASLDMPAQKSGKLDLANIEKLLEQYEASNLTGADLPKEIRKKRMNQLVDFLTTERDLDDTQSFVAETLGDSIGNLLAKSQDTPQVNRLIKAIIAQDPDLLGRVRDCRELQEQRKKLEQEIETLQKERAGAEKAFSDLKENTRDVETSIFEQRSEELTKLEAEYTQKKDQLDGLLQQLEVAHNVFDLDKEKNKLEQKISDIEVHKRFLDEGTQRLETAFSEMINNHHDRMVNIAFDGYMSNTMITAAAKWEAERVAQKYAETVETVNAVPASDMGATELIEYLCRTIKTARPQYENNDIINIAICMAQGFLTVFSGEPGCGKTSICNLMGEALGLRKIGKLAKKADSMLETGRYIVVSVERGWTSKRDFIGYYNPLSKNFDKSNRCVFNGLKLLDVEAKNYYAKFPFLILLDEANLSPMEYYWADFMNVCDDLDEDSEINLGEDYSFKVPQTLHFVATINNDHTTETLSPRLIDRAWIISLPRFSTFSAGSKIHEDEVVPVTWQSIKNAFIPDESIVVSMPIEIQQIYDSLLTRLRKNVVLSPRAKKAIEHFWYTGARCFEENRDGIVSEKIALDYAVAQKILPKIVGSGKEYKEWLEGLKLICTQNDLNKSAELLKVIIAKGDDQMGYYRFFYNND